MVDLAPMTTALRPAIVPMGDSGLLVRFGTVLSEPANAAAIAFARHLERRPLAGVAEVVPNLVSVLLRYDPATIDLAQLAGELRLRLFSGSVADVDTVNRHVIPVRFGRDAGPDLGEIAGLLSMSEAAFVALHNAVPLRVLATGFAPGFVYCGFHPTGLHLPRRSTVRSVVPAGSILFAAGQTAIAATAIPTGWHVIGQTAFRNFDPSREPPTLLRAGDEIAFEALR